MKNEENDSLLEPNRLVVFGQGQSLYLFDEINNASVAEVIKISQFIITEFPKKEMQIILNTPGGTVYDGLALFDYLMSIKNPLTIIGTGLVASMGIIILLAGQKRYVTKNTRLMSHQIATQVAGKVSDVKIDLEETKKLEKICVGIIAERTGQSIKTIEKEIKLGDKYMSAEEALKKNYIHRII